MSKETGGPAYPSANEVEFGNVMTKGHPGMTLRDWFAGQALQGLCKDTAWDYARGICNAELIKRSWVIADAMIAAKDA
jgi:hypothetical protein